VIAGPVARVFVSLGDLQKRTGVDWRTILTRCNDLDLIVYVDRPEQKAKYCVSATEAKMVVASLAADKNRKALKTTAEAMGVCRDRLKRILERKGLITLRSVRRQLLIDPVAAREALLSDLATETLDAASKRTGIGKNQLRQWLREEGLLPLVANRRKSWLEPAAVDAVVARRKVMGLETLRQASARTGVRMTSLRRALVAAGVVMIGQGRQRPWIDPAVVDAALLKRPGTMDVG
jgi:phage antirepressor YoqD-like protein